MLGGRAHRGQGDKYKRSPSAVQGQGNKAPKYEESGPPQSVSQPGNSSPITARPDSYILWFLYSSGSARVDHGAAVDERGLCSGPFFFFLGTRLMSHTIRDN